jgi:hypothetical protein
MNTLIKELFIFHFIVFQQCNQLNAMLATFGLSKTLPAALPLFLPPVFLFFRPLTLPQPALCASLLRSAQRKESPEESPGMPYLCIRPKFPGNETPNTFLFIFLIGSISNCQCTELPLCTNPVPRIGQDFRDHLWYCALSELSLYKRIGYNYPEPGDGPLPSTE